MKIKMWRNIMSKQYTIQTKAGMAVTYNKGHNKTGRALKHAFLWAAGSLMQDFNMIYVKDSRC